MRSKIIAVGKFIRLIDENGVLSLTNLAVLVVLVKMALVPSFSLTEAGSLFIALLSYSYKKVLNKGNVEVTDSVSKALDEIKSKVSNLEIKSGISRFER